MYICIFILAISPYIYIIDTVFPMSLQTSPTQQTGNSLQVRPALWRSEGETDLQIVPVLRSGLLMVLNLEHIFIYKTDIDIYCIYWYIYIYTHVYIYIYIHMQAYIHTLHQLMISPVGFPFPNSNFMFSWITSQHTMDTIHQNQITLIVSPNYCRYTGCLLGD